MTTPEVSKLIERENVKEIALQFADISGTLHTLWVPSKLFPKAVEEGVHTDGSSVAMVDISKSDLKLVPDVNTLKLLPQGIFPYRVARAICDIYEPESDKSFELDPRFVLKRVINDVNKGSASLKYCACSEIEFFLFKRTEAGIQLLDEGAYLATPPADSGAELRLEMTEYLREMGILIEKHHHEVPPGKYEFNLEYSDALTMADTIYLIKFLLKQTAAKKGLIASFMPKPFQGQYGCGLHTHVSVIDGKKAKNLFYDPKGSYGLSKMGLSFVSGILTHARALAALTNPSVNSYKRLVPGWEAPVYISWARYNRSVLLRVPPGKELRTRLEYRPTDGSCNFYVAFAAILAAGIDGVKRELEPEEPVEENIYRMDAEERHRRGVGLLPEDLGEALREFAKDKVLQDALGYKFCEKFIELKTKEWRDFNTAVHEWERKRYMDV
jgi:glutamine synthetase